MNSTSTSTGAVHQDPAITNLIRDGVSSDESVRGFYADRAWRLCGNGSNRAHLVYARSFQNITLSVDVPPMSVDEAIHGRGRPPCCWWTYPLSTVDESTREGGHVRRRALVHGSGRTGGRAQRKLGSPLQTREPEMAARTRSKVTRWWCMAPVDLEVERHRSTGLTVCGCHGQSVGPDRRRAQQGYRTTTRMQPSSKPPGARRLVARAGATGRTGSLNSGTGRGAIPHRG